MSILETVTDWMVIGGTLILASVIIMSWLASYRMLKTTPVTSGDWFFVLPTWAQIVGGLGACVLFAYLGYLLWIPLPLSIPPNVETLLQLIGLVFFLVGWSLVLWARWTLGALYGVSTSFAAPLQAQHQLIQNGPYAIVRHPMYLGYWLLLLGVTLIYRAWAPLVFLVMCLASFFRRASREESTLAERFGDKWRAYTVRVPMFVPRGLIGAKRRGETKR